MYLTAVLNVNRLDLLSDEEAQEVAKLLHKTQKPEPKPERWQPNSFLQDSSMVDSSGPVSLNDSLGPPSLQEESVVEPMTELDGQSFFDNASRDIEPLSQYYESTSSLDLSGKDEEEPSKVEGSVSATDSGLIGEFSRSCCRWRKPQS